MVSEEIEMKIREGLTRFTQLILGFDGILHLAEMFAAWHEGAWITFGLTTFHTLIFFLAVYLVGHDNLHHKE